MKIFFALFILANIAGCNHESGNSAPPMTAANIAEVRKTLSSVSDVNSAVVSANDANASPTGAQSRKQRTKSFKALSAFMRGVPRSHSSQPSHVSEKAQAMAEKLSTNQCDITVSGLDNLPSDSGTPNDLQNMNIKIYAGGATCPIYYNLQITAIPTQINLNLQFYVVSEEFKTTSELQSIDLKVQMTGLSTDPINEASMTILGDGKIVTLSQGTIGAYINAGLHGTTNNFTTADIDMGLVYPTFKTDVRLLANSQYPNGQYFLNGRAISGDALATDFGAGN